MEALNTVEDVSTPLDELLEYLHHHLANKSVDVQRIQDIASKWTGLEPEEDYVSLFRRKKKAVPIRNDENGINGEDGKLGKRAKKPSMKAKVVEVEWEGDDELMMKPSSKASKKANEPAPSPEAQKMALKKLLQMTSDDESNDEKPRSANKKASKSNVVKSNMGKPLAAGKAGSSAAAKGKAANEGTSRDASKALGEKGTATVAGSSRTRSGNNRVETAEKIASEDDKSDSDMAGDGEVANFPRRKADEDESEKTVDEEEED